jgi:hypothetical protein
VADDVTAAFKKMAERFRQLAAAFAKPHVRATP